MMKEALIRGVIAKINIIKVKFLKIFELYLSIMMQWYQLIRFI